MGAHRQALLGREVGDRRRSHHPRSPNPPSSGTSTTEARARANTSRHAPAGQGTLRPEPGTDGHDDAEGGQAERRGPPSARSSRRTDGTGDGTGGEEQPTERDGEARPERRGPPALVGVPAGARRHRCRRGWPATSGGSGVRRRRGPRGGSAGSVGAGPRGPARPGAPAPHEHGAEGEEQEGRAGQSSQTSNHPTTMRQRTRMATACHGDGPVPSSPSSLGTTSQAAGRRRCRCPRPPARIMAPMRTSVGSTPRYSATPPQTPAIIRSSRSRTSRRGPIGGGPVSRRIVRRGGAARSGVSMASIVLHPAASGIGDDPDGRSPMAVSRGRGARSRGGPT